MRQLVPIQRIMVGLTAFFLFVCFFVLAAIPVELGSRQFIVNSRSPVYVSDEVDASFAYRVDNTFIDSLSWWECLNLNLSVIMRLSRQG